MASNIDQPLGLARYLPREIQGWKVWGKDESYDRQTIFDYIDGGGEVYRSYNFRALLVRHLHDESMPEIVVDFFDMGLPADAFGVFTHDLDGEKVDVGQEGVYKSGLLSFWQDRFFVSIYCEEETAEIRNGIFETGRTIARAIGSAGQKPDIVALVPLGRFDGDVRYFHTHPILNYHFYVSNENILLLDAKTEAVLARPAQKGAKERLLILRYAGEEKTEAARTNFVKSYMPDASPLGMVKTEDGTWTGIRMVKNHLVVIFHAASEKDAATTLSSIMDLIGRLETVRAAVRRMDRPDRPGWKGENSK